MKILQGIIFDAEEDNVIIKEFTSSKRGFTTKYKDNYSDKERYSFIFKEKEIDIDDALSDIANKDAKDAINTAVKAYFKA